MANEVPDNQPVTCRSCGAPGALGRARGPVICRGCRRRVCVACGCTDERACAIECIDQPLICSWVEARPEICLFCLWAEAERAYREVTRAEALIWTPGASALVGAEELLLL